MTRDYEAAAEMDDIYGEQEALGVAFRKFVNHVAGTNEDADVQVIEATFRALDEVDALRARVDELEAQNAALEHRLEKLGDIGQQKTSKEQKIAAIVTYADNARRPGQSGVTVSPQNIQGAAGVGERYAYKLIDQIVHGDGENGTIGPDGYDWAHDPAVIPRPVDQDLPEKSVLIDFEGVHGQAVSLNEFNNATAVPGAAD